MPETLLLYCKSAKRHRKSCEARGLMREVSATGTVFKAACTYIPGSTIIAALSPREPM